MLAQNTFLKHTGVESPIICGPMYPCSNPELVAAVSESGALGVIQPISLTYVYGYSFIDGLRYIKSLTSKPVGMNLLIESSSSKYRSKMESWMNIALDEGIRFFITSMGKPDWVINLAHQVGAIVYHDVTSSKWANIAVDLGADGLIAVNNQAGGHAGQNTSQQLFDELSYYGLPVVCAGGVATVDSFKVSLDYGYQAVQMGTRFIASEECAASNEYKQAILDATADDIVLTHRMTGIPVSVINNAYVKSIDLLPNKFETFMLKNSKFKGLMRAFLAIKSLRLLKTSLSKDQINKYYWQAGKSVEGIESILPVKSIIDLYIQ